MSATERFLNRTKCFTVQPEISAGFQNYSMFNDAGTEVEVSEFLYSFARMIKPHCILETGTHKGVSASYFAMACEDNDRGTIYTFEIIPEHFNNANRMFLDTGFSIRIINLLMDAITFDASGLSIDLLFLDSEPQLRFNEFVKFWPQVRPGGFIIIHDLHPSLGHHGGMHQNMFDWPYGYFGDKLGSFIQRHEIQTISFDTPRGLTVFQKARSDFSHTRLLKGEIENHSELVELSQKFPVKMG